MDNESFYVKVGTVAQLMDVFSKLPPEAEVFLDNEERLIGISYDWLNEDVYLSDEITPGHYPYHVWKEKNDG